MMAGSASRPTVESNTLSNDVSLPGEIRSTLEPGLNVISFVFGLSFYDLNSAFIFLFERFGRMYRTIWIRAMWAVLNSYVALHFNSEEQKYALILPYRL